MAEKQTQDKKKEEKKKYFKPRIIDQREFERRPLMVCAQPCKLGGPSPQNQVS